MISGTIPSAYFVWLSIFGPPDAFHYMLEVKTVTLVSRSMYYLNTHAPRKFKHPPPTLRASALEPRVSIFGNDT